MQSLNQLRLDEILGIADLKSITGTLTAELDWKNIKEVRRRLTIEIDTILYKNVQPATSTLISQ